MELKAILHFEDDILELPVEIKERKNDGQYILYAYIEKIGMNERIIEISVFLNKKKIIKMFKNMQLTSGNSFTLEVTTYYPIREEI